jgi:hypothetical protein
MLVLSIAWMGCTPEPSGKDGDLIEGLDDTASTEGDADADGDSDSDSDSDADGDSDADSDGDTDADTDADTGPAGTSNGDFTVVYDSRSYAVSFASGGYWEVLCATDTEYYRFTVRDSADYMQLAVDVPYPAAGLSVSTPEMKGVLMSLGPVGDWALDTTYKGNLNHAWLELSAFEAGIRMAGSLEVVWDYDGATLDPAASATGDFEVFCP